MNSSKESNSLRALPYTSIAKYAILDISSPTFKGRYPAETDLPSELSSCAEESILSETYARGCSVQSWKPCVITPPTITAISTITRTTYNVALLLLLFVLFLLIMYSFPRFGAICVPCPDYALLWRIAAKSILFVLAAILKEVHLLPSKTLTFLDLT